MSFKILALALVLGLAAAQSTCPCEINEGTTCSTIAPAGGDRCSISTTACSGCVCTDGGSLTCSLSNENVLKFNGTDDFCEIQPIPVANCPSENVFTRQCCFSGQEGILVVCELAPLPAFTSFDYSLSGLGQGTFDFPDTTTAQNNVLIDITLTGTPIGSPSFTNPTFGTNSTLVDVPGGVQSTFLLPTNYIESFSGITAGDARFDYLAGGNTSFSVILSAQLGDAIGNSEKSSENAGCFDFTFQV